MYNNIKTKNITEALLSAGRDVQYNNIKEDHSDKEVGDIEFQLHTLGNEINELDKLVNELCKEIEPILSHEPASDCCDKACAEEKSISPLATELRNINYKVRFTKSTIMNVLTRIQL